MTDNYSSVPPCIHLLADLKGDEEQLGWLLTNSLGWGLIQGLQADL